MGIAAAGLLAMGTGRGRAGDEPPPGNSLPDIGTGVGATGSRLPAPDSRVPRPASRAPQEDPYLPNIPYDGRFTFVRVRFEPLGGGEGWRGRDVKWDHDYHKAEWHFHRILHELTTVSTHLDESNILTLDDPELMKFPIAYMSEPGFWTLSDKEAQGLRTYLQKGGFIIFDDFAGQHWYNFAEQMKKVLPDAQLIPLDASHPIFDSFFHIESLDFDHPYYRVKAQFLGVFEDNDPSKRMLAIANYNNDIGDYWEWSDEGFLPIALSNQAYRLGVNYVVYAMSH
jgi:Domain of unknown function (DUF4159)